MNQVQVDYATLVEVLQAEVSAQLNQIINYKATIKAYDKALTEALDKVSELESTKTSSRKKAVNTVKDAGTY